MTEKSYRIEGMDCADCALKVEKGVRQLDGVRTAQVDFATGLLWLDGEPGEEPLRRRVEALGYGLAQRAAEKPIDMDQGRPRRTNAVLGFLSFLLGRTETRLALIGGALLLAGFTAGWFGLPALLSGGLQFAALLVAGWPIARSGLATLFINRDFNINLLMTIAAVGAVVIGDLAEAATLIFLFAVAEALEGYTTDRARHVLGELTDLAPAAAVLIHAGDGNGGRQHEHVVPVEQLRIGDRILVKPGERIPMDGVVRRGSSDVNQAPITGESQPVDKIAGDEVFAGTINGPGTLEVDVTRLVADNTLNRIIHLVEKAQSLRAPAQRMIDRFARVYTPAMVVVAALVAAVPPLLFGEPFLNTPAERGWLYRALALLVIACPCALVISAPVTVLSAITSAARQGILFKGGVFLEMLSKVKVFAFDKTGTLTAGQPQLTLCRSVDCAAADDCADCDDVLGLAYALEQHSTHPLARAVNEAAEARGLNTHYAPAADVVALAGRGVRGQVDGRLATIGSHTLFDAEHPHVQAVCDMARAAEHQGHTAMLVSDGERVRGVIAVADPVRESSAAAVQQLNAMGIQTVMLTGDNSTVANRVAAQVGIREVRAGLLPEEKVSVVKEIGRHGAVAMVGDGINDTPALAAADIGVTLGGAVSGQALETADVVLMAGGLSQLPLAVRISAFANRLVRANIAISLLAKLAFIVLALMGITSMWLAVAADMGVSLLVTLNGLRPLLQKQA